MIETSQWWVPFNWVSPFLHGIGVEPRTPSTAYNFWSGFGSDLSEFAIIGYMAKAAHHANCHTYRCWRLGRHVVANGQYKLCSHCHRQLHDIKKSEQTLKHIIGVHEAVTK
jgi:hypothetical protein